MTPTRRLWLGSAAAALAACRRGGSSRLRLVSYQGAETPQIARALGLFEKHGLDVDLQELPGAAKAMQALLGGSADVILGTYDQVLQVRAQGQSVKAFLLISECHCLGLVVPQNSPVHSIADLKGRTVCVSAPGGPMQNFVAYLLRRAGLEPDDAAYAGIGIGASSVVALEHGKVDAGVVFYSSLLELKKRQPGMRILGETYTRSGSKAVFGQESFPSTCLIARTTWLDRHGDAARRMVRVFRETIDWMLASPVEAVRAQLPRESRNPDVEIDLATLRILIPMFSRTGRLTRAAAQLSLDVLAAARPQLTRLDVPLEETFTAAFLPAP